MDPKKQEAIQTFRENRETAVLAESESAGSAKTGGIIRTGDGMAAFEALESARIEAKIRAEERRDILRMRKVWSLWILVSILLIVIFDIFIVLALGFGWIHFEQDFILPTFIAESLIKIFGLALIVVKFLFNREDLPKEKLSPVETEETLHT